MFGVSNFKHATWPPLTGLTESINAVRLQTHIFKIANEGKIIPKNSSTNFTLKEN